jgi:hypothetical protein
MAHAEFFAQFTGVDEERLVAPVAPVMIRSAITGSGKRLRSTSFTRLFLRKDAPQYDIRIIHGLAGRPIGGRSQNLKAEAAVKIYRDVI